MQSVLKSINNVVKTNSFTLLLKVLCSVTGLWSLIFSLYVVFVEPLPHRSGSLKSLPIHVGTDAVAELLVWWAPDHEPYCGLLPTNQVWRWTDNSKWGLEMLSTGWILWRIHHSRNNTETEGFCKFKNFTTGVSRAICKLKILANISDEIHEASYNQKNYPQYDCLLMIDNRNAVLSQPYTGIAKQFKNNKHARSYLVRWCQPPRMT